MLMGHSFCAGISVPCSIQMTKNGTNSKRSTRNRRGSLRTSGKQLLFLPKKRPQMFFPVLSYVRVICTNKQDTTACDSPSTNSPHIPLYALMNFGICFPSLILHCLQLFNNRYVLDRKLMSYYQQRKQP